MTKNNSLEFPLKWLSSYSVGNEELDEHHQILFGVINKLNEAVEDNKTDEIEPIFKELLNYVDYHFRAEEQHMKSINYPYLDDHLKQHREFELKVIAYKKSIDVEGITETSKRMINYLCNWITTHIMTADQKYHQHQKT